MVTCSLIQTTIKQSRPKIKSSSKGEKLRNKSVVPINRQNSCTCLNNGEKSTKYTDMSESTASVAIINYY